MRRLLGILFTVLLVGTALAQEDTVSIIPANLTDEKQEGETVVDAIKSKASEVVPVSTSGEVASSVKSEITSRATLDAMVEDNTEREAVEFLELTSKTSTTIMEAATFALALVMAALVLPLAIAYRVSASFRQAILALSTKQIKVKHDSDNHLATRDYQPKMLVDTTKPCRTLLTEEIMSKLIPSLPYHLSAKDWQLAYSSEIHGYSLHSAYRRTAAVGPCVLIGMDMNKYMFAAFCSESLKPNGANYFGNGECWVASLAPRFQVFKWTPGNNEQFVLATDSFLAFGGGGSFALWFDAQFDRGTSEPNVTFGNATYLSSSETFKIDTIEIWCFATPSVSASLRAKALRTMSSAFGRIMSQSSFPIKEG